MNDEYTSWFPADQVPGRAGVYETTHPADDSKTFQLWTGEYWGYCASEVHQTHRARSSDQHSFKWRGLAKKP